MAQWRGNPGRGGGPWAVWPAGGSCRPSSRPAIRGNRAILVFTAVSLWRVTRAQPGRGRGRRKSCRLKDVPQVQARPTDPLSARRSAAQVWLRFGRRALGAEVPLDAAAMVPVWIRAKKKKKRNAGWGRLRRGEPMSLLGAVGLE